MAEQASFAILLGAAAIRWPQDLWLFLMRREHERFSRARLNIVWRMCVPYIYKFAHRIGHTHNTLRVFLCMCMCPGLSRSYIVEFLRARGTFERVFSRARGGGDQCAVVRLP